MRAPVRRLTAACNSGTKTSWGTKRLRDALADETTDRLDFGDDHRDRDPLSFDCGRGRVRSLNKGVNPPPQVALGPLADPAAIDVERELGPALDKYNAGIDRAQLRNFEFLLQTGLGTRERRGK